MKTISTRRSVNNGGIAALLLLTLIGTFSTPSRADDPPQSDYTVQPMAGLPSHPRLLLLASELPAIHARIAHDTWAKAFYDGLQKRADADLAKAVQLPPEGGQWFHWYVCPIHGVELKMESPTRAVCPVDGQVFTGYPYDEVYMAKEHNDFANETRDLGLMYQLTGDKRYADKAKEILLAYADKYLSYPLHDIYGKPKVGGGRVQPQTLDESTWLIPMAQGMDCIWDTLSPEEIETIRTKLFYPAAVDVIMRHKMKIHNIQNWKNSAVGLTGLLFGDQRLVSDAIDSDHGFRAQMAQGVLPDGPWLEGAWGYQFYMMDASHYLTEAAYRCGIDLYGDAYHRLYLAPLIFAMPDGKLPAFNDSKTDTAAGNPDYEIALLRYNDPRFAQPLQTSNRQNLQALIDGVDTLPSSTAPAVHSENYEAEGYGILTLGAGTDATWLCVKYGPHGGGHGHPDKNQFVIYGDGRMIADDPGTELYGSPLHLGWDKTTLAHNTLTVDETNQLPATGKCLGYKLGKDWGAVLTDSGPAIPNISFRRAIFLLGQNLIVVEDTIRATDGKPHELDLAYHPTGAWLNEPAGDPFTPPAKPGYQYLRDVRSVAQPGPLRLTVQNGPAPSAVTFLPGSDPTTYLLGTGIGSHGTNDRVPIAIARRTTAATTYIWAVEINATGAGPVLTPITDAPTGPIAVNVAYDNQKWQIIANPDSANVKTDAYSGTDTLAVVAR